MDGSIPSPPTGSAPPEPGVPADPMDRAPEPAGFRRPPGLIWASALAGVVIVAALTVALRNPAPTAGPTASVPRSGAGLFGQGTSLVGQPAPSIVVDDLPLDPDSPPGPAHDVRQLLGKPVVVNLWASSCAPCEREMPAFEAVHRELGDRVAFLGIAVNDMEASSRSLARRTGVSYPLGRDPRGSVLLALGGTGLPVTVVIDAEGIVRFQRAAEVSADELRAAVEPLLA